MMIFVDIGYQRLGCVPQRGEVIGVSKGSPVGRGAGAPGLTASGTPGPASLGAAWTDSSHSPPSPSKGKCQSQ